MSTLSIYVAGQWHNFCENRKMDIGLGGVFRQINPGDFVYANGEWRELCPTPIYVGLATEGKYRTNTGTAGCSSCVNYKLWFTTAKNDGTTLYGDDSGPPLSRDTTVTFQFSPDDGHIGDYDVSFKLTGEREGDVQPGLDPEDIGHAEYILTFDVHLKVGFRACAVDLEIEYPGGESYPYRRVFNVKAISDKSNMDSQTLAKDEGVDWGYQSITPTETDIALEIEAQNIN